MTEPVNDTYFTGRLGLLVHSMSDELDAQVSNWERLDTSFAGAVWVTPGTVPDNDILYDGMIVAERDTGKVWRAQKDALGNFQQKWIKYPWLITGTTSASTYPNGQADRLMGFSTVDTNHCVNSSAADLRDTRIVVPVDGLYSIRARCGWSGGGNYRSMRIAVDDVIDTANAEHTVGSWPTFPYPQNNLNTTRKIFKGQTVLVALWQASGSDNIPFDLRVEVALVRAL